MQSSLVCRELIGNLLWSLNNPQVEVFGLYDEVVTIANLLLNLGNFFARESGYDTIYESSVNATTLVKPLLEVCTKVPQLNILINAILQHVAIQENELAGEDNQTLRGIAIESLIAAIQQLNQLTGIT